MLEELIDRLLASPRFGERWGRHWLDVVRFGESLTRAGFSLLTAWRYRDYVIDAFNADRPYDRFVASKWPATCCPPTTPPKRRRQLTATAFLALGNTNLEEQDKQQAAHGRGRRAVGYDREGLARPDDRLRRCHDHKFDPIPTRDYYALAGILATRARWSTPTSRNGSNSGCRSIAETEAK